MSNFISRGVKSVRKALHLPAITLGNIATKYAPAALAITGVGGPVAGAISKVASAGNAIQGVKRPITPTTTFPSGSGTFSSPGFAPGPFPVGGGGTGAPTPTGGGGGPTGIGWLDTLLGGVGDAAKSAGSYVKNNPLEVAMGGLAGAQAVNAAKASARQGKLTDEAIGLAKERWAGGAPLRAKATAGLLNPPKADLSSVYANPQNPFSVSAQRRPMTPTRPPVPSNVNVPVGPTAPPPVALPPQPPPPTNRLPLLPAAKRRLALPGMRY